MKLHCTDVKGLPGFRFYRHFVEEMLLPFVRVDVDDEMKRTLVGRLDKIAGLLGEEYALFFESYMSTAKVVEVRRYGVPPPKMRYDYETVAYRGGVIDNCSVWRQGIEIIVRYDANGELLGYTFPDRDPEPMAVSAWLGDFADDTSRVERIIDYMCDTSRFDGMFVSAEGGNSTFSVSRHGNEWSIEWWPFVTELFRIENRKIFQYGCIEIVAAFANKGTSAALSLYNDWHAIHDSDEVRQYIEISKVLTALYMRTERMRPEGWEQIIRSLRECGIDGKPENYAKVNMSVPEGDEWSRYGHILRGALADIEHFEGTAGGQKLMYLAMHGYEGGSQSTLNLFRSLAAAGDPFVSWHCCE